jgi:hypothetical protein
MVTIPDKNAHEKTISTLPEMSTEKNIRTSLCWFINIRIEWKAQPPRIEAGMKIIQRIIGYK